MMMVIKLKELKVDSSTCIGCGACAAIAENYFKINDEGISEVTSQENLDNPSVQEAIDSCPVAAIKLEEK